jgi:SlyX protein
MEVMILDENRVIEIETKLAHQEHLLSELNEALTDQQAQISGLERLCQSLIERVKSLLDSSSADQVTDDRPPHY